ncbi:hypothetical protein [Clostridium magnum]|uniref:Uncharacterized protein n=1 Tax=Clostridium magnum DSM 2767 TaxID=1121326 RepID=A0A162QN32_9CLOT|nr:hypothetical protein [Clostridium magnum]KZL88737.1 hypothetical protein CLMAG_60260 [Clostridium magnum DSM 2767]SHJ61841.1 hypothetical protein SAMN02745944_06244 [Clostridium magnum DSM 2767]
MRNINRINTVVFQRIKNANWELGLGLEFDNGDSTLVDGEGNKVKELWDCKDFSGLDIKTNLFEEFKQLHYKK